MFFRYLVKRGVAKIFENSDVAVKILFSDGSVYVNHPSKDGDIYDVTVHFKHPKAERWFALMGGVGFGEAYHQGLIDVNENDLEALIDVVRSKFISIQKPPLLVRIRRFVYEWRVNNKDISQAKRNAIFHYNYPAEFYRLIQGDTYGYVEGYWQTGHETLDQSMHNRFDYMCRKLHLKPGLKVAEVGSGWGYMTNLMARDYGVTVDTYGIVEGQNKTLLAMASQWGVQDKVTLLEEDHRNLKQRPCTYDRYVSLGVFEHAGKDCQEDWMDSIATSLKEGGIGLLSVMTYSSERYTDFMTTKYIFPGGNIPSIGKVIDMLEARGLYVLDLENARHHYALAAQEWKKNFQKNWSKIQALNPELFNERFRRTWFLYLMGAGTAFESPQSNLSIQQIVFSKGRKHTYPTTRDFLYCPTR
ncbi:hypothetical protein COZ82_01315 [Candidatus Kaiserbacteria bacterium CG_4_8_14_3_um_filter_38_9]|uniref:Cyclopropane-fatty-acyl-phospholipid synthase n=1 Tax=Candidatus Kaiserbacteria bacterium CG_4_8_14_3_um_filter_38_9 TaxID=1974599 RepID=A0A2M7IP77_9BACT|nr:MAG: hypothetical protein COZ82_01315 [Candidatus Kaiserbacteria bacterium CG_4_8_14_3_um_filter_38_9]